MENLPFYIDSTGIIGNTIATDTAYALITVLAQVPEESPNILYAQAVEQIGEAAVALLFLEIFAHVAIQVIIAFLEPRIDK